MEDNGTTQNQNDTPKKSSYLRYIIPAVLIPLIIIVALVFIWFTQEEPQPDPASEKLIREAAVAQIKIQTNILKDPNELTEEDFTKISFIWIHRRQLSDLRLFEKFTNLKELYLTRIICSKNTIPVWMKVLAKLGIYDFKERYFIDLSPLGKISNLQYLKLSDIPINNIKPVASLAELKRLELFETHISNIEPVKNLKKLRSLFINEKRITNIEPLKGLINLQELELYNTKVSNLEPLTKLAKLQKLDINNSPISDFKPLTGLVNLQVLIYTNCPNITNKQVAELQKALPKLKINQL